MESLPATGGSIPEYRGLPTAEVDLSLSSDPEMRRAAQLSLEQKETPSMSRAEMQAFVKSIFGGMPTFETYTEALNSCKASFSHFIHTGLDHFFLHRIAFIALSTTHLRSVMTAKRNYDLVFHPEIHLYFDIAMAVAVAETACKIGNIAYALFLKNARKCGVDKQWTELKKWWSKLEDYPAVCGLTVASFLITAVAILAINLVLATHLCLRGFFIVCGREARGHAVEVFGFLIAVKQVKDALKSVKKGMTDHQDRVLERLTNRYQVKQLVQSEDPDKETIEMESTWFDKLKKFRQIDKLDKVDDENRDKVVLLSCGDFFKYEGIAPVLEQGESCPTCSEKEVKMLDLKDVILQEDMAIPIPLSCGHFYELQSILHILTTGEAKCPVGSCHQELDAERKIIGKKKLTIINPYKKLGLESHE